MVNKTNIKEKKMSDVTNLPSVDNLPEETKKQIQEVFNESVEKKARAKTRVEKRNVAEYADSLKETYEKRIKQINESAEKRIKLNARKEKMLSEKKVAQVEAKFNAKTEAQMKKYALKAYREIVAENKVPNLEQEDAEKMAKLLKLFEEMLGIFGKQIVDVVEDKEEESKEKDEKIEDLEKEVEETEKEVEDLKESIASLTRQNVLLEAALKNNLAYDDVREYAKGIRFKNKSQFSSEVKEIVESRAYTSSKVRPTRSISKRIGVEGSVSDATDSYNVEEILFSRF